MKFFYAFIFHGKGKNAIVDGIAVQPQPVSIEQASKERLLLSHFRVERRRGGLN